MTDKDTRDWCSLKEAEAYEKKGDYQSAIKSLSALIESSPSDYRRWYARAMDKWTAGDTSGYLSDYKKSIALGRKATYNDYFIKASAETMLGQYSEAANDYYKATQFPDIEPAKRAFCYTYRSALLKDGGGEFLKRKFLLENPAHFETFIKNGGTFSQDPTPQANKPDPYSPARPQPQKLVYPVGTKPFLILGILKGSGTQVLYTTIARIDKIGAILDADPRFEKVRYMSIPDEEYNNYPHY